MGFIHKAKTIREVLEIQEESLRKLPLIESTDKAWRRSTYELNINHLCNWYVVKAQHLILNPSKPLAKKLLVDLKDGYASIFPAEFEDIITEQVMLEFMSLLEWQGLEHSDAYSYFDVKYIKLYSKEENDKPKSKLKYFGWIGEIDDLIDLWNDLISAGYIHSDTTLERFRHAFLEDNYDGSLEPIKWLKNKNLCTYLIYQLVKKKVISTEDEYRFFNKATKHHFDIDGNTHNDWFNNMTNPKGHQRIDTLLKTTPHQK